MRCPALVAIIVPLMIGSIARAEEPLTLDVWPGLAPGEKADAPPEQWAQPKPGAKPAKRVTNVTKPTLTVFRPAKEKDTGVVVIVCPGGGYKSLMMDYEGEDAAKWLNTIGITGIVLKYRIPGHEGAPKHVPALQDAQRSLSLVRSKAKEWGIHPGHVGMLGFSAGAHLTAAASTNFDQRAYEPIDAVDQLGCRPDFAIVIYPGGVIDGHDGKLAPEIRVSAQTPPMFIAQATDDRVNVENSAYLYLAMARAGVKTEMHLYATGGHGFGLKPSTQPASTWTDRCEAWLLSQHLLGDSASH